MLSNIDFNKLRKDLLAYYESAYFVGGFGVAIIDISKIENSTNEELIKIAIDLKFNLDNYRRS